MTIDVLYLDNHLLVLNKPCGLLTQPTKEENESLLGWGKQFLKSTFKKPGRVFLEAVHRIDKPVSGIVVFARTSKSLARCMSAVRDRKSKKIYLALVEGRLKKASGVLQHYLIHGSFRAQLAKRNDAGAKEALLSYEVLKQDAKHALVRIELKTGRYHQIRAQLAALGHPILGDKKYGSKELFGRPGAIALHHSELFFPHPVKEEILHLKAPLPDFWQLN